MAKIDVALAAIVDSIESRYAADSISAFSENGTVYVSLRRDLE